MGRGKRPFTQKQIDHVASELTELAGEVAAFSRRLAQDEFSGENDELDVEGGVTVMGLIDGVHGWLKNLEVAYNKVIRDRKRAAIGLPVPGTSEEE